MIELQLISRYSGKRWRIRRGRVIPPTISFRYQANPDEFYDVEVVGFRVVKDAETSSKT